MCIKNYHGTEYSERPNPNCSSWQNFFFCEGFFFMDTDDSQDSRGEAEDHFLFHSTTWTRSQIIRHLFATFHVRWLSHIFKCTACIYQTVTRRDLPPYQITIWLVDNVMLVFVCLLDAFILGFCYSSLDTGNWWTRTRINYHPRVTSKPTNQVC